MTIQCNTTGFVAAAISICAFVLATELLPAAKRAKWAIYNFAFFAVGIVLSVLVTMQQPKWRNFIWVTAGIYALFIPVQLLFVQER
jgi:MFS family permease